MFAHRFNVVPQGSKISKGCRLVLRAAQQSGRVEGTHEQDAALFVQLAMLLGHGEILSDASAGRQCGQGRPRSLASAGGTAPAARAYRLRSQQAEGHGSAAGGT